MKRIVALFLALILAGGAFTACSQPSAGAKASVKDAWARPGPAGGSTAIYFTVDNRAGPADVLFDVECAAGSITQVHKTEQDASGVLKMVHQASVPVPAGGDLPFEPGGLHVMVMDLKNELRPGEKLPFTLHFEKAGAVQLEAPVREP